MDEIRCKLEHSPIDFAFVDVETNGLHPECSVLSCAATIKRASISPLQFAEKKRIVRFYYPQQPVNMQALRIHGLSIDEITRRRTNARYPRHFIDEMIYGEVFSQVDYIVCHNADFEEVYLPTTATGPYFCTMSSNIDTVRRRRRDGTLKFPSLRETAIHYRISYDEGELHGSDYDAELTSRVFEAMLRRENS